MKKLSLIIFFITISSLTFAQQKGDSLAILFKRVYTYKTPGDLASRTGFVYSYRNKKRVPYYGKNEKYPGYYQIKLPNNEIAYIKATRVSTDQTLTHKQIRAEVNAGSRKSSPNQLFVGYKKLNLPKWSFWIAGLVSVILLYFLWRRYYIIERWFYKKARKTPPRSCKPPWYIKWIAISGMVIGSLQLFAQDEVFWFMQEGFQFWGTYPNNYGWIMWGASMAAILFAIIAIIGNFKRFPVKISILYSLLTLLISVLYFSLGYMIGAIVLMLAFMGGSGGNKVSLTGEKRYMNGQTQWKGYDGEWYVER